ncbi:MAG: dehydrogenase, partial [Pseudomonadota bacterium]
MAQALWCTGPGHAELRPAASPTQGLRVRTRFSAISRGTEKLVFEGRVPVDQFDIMKAPYQEGSFPFPVK